MNCHMLITLAGTISSFCPNRSHVFGIRNSVIQLYDSKDTPSRVCDWWVGSLQGMLSHEPMAPSQISLHLYLLRNMR